MRILLWYWGRRGGGAQYSAALAEALARRSDVTVSAAVSTRLETADRMRQAVALNLSDVHRPIGAALAALPTSRSIASVARRWRADVVLHSMVNPLTTPSLVWLRRACIPLVTVIHDAAPHEGDRHALMDLAVRASITYSDSLVAASDHVASMVHRNSGRRSVVIPLGPHVPMPDLWDPAGPVLFVGRMRRYKGLDLLAEAWGSLRPEQRVPLRIVGECNGDPVVDHSLARLRALGADVQDRWIPEPELPGVLKGARLIVLPYREATQSGVVTLARSAGIPLLVTDVGGLREQVATGGLVVPPSATSLADALGQLLGDPAQLRALRPSSAADEGIWDDLGDRFIGVLGDVVRRGPVQHRHRR